MDSGLGCTLITKIAKLSHLITRAKRIGIPFAHYEIERNLLRKEMAQLPSIELKGYDNV